MALRAFKEITKWDDNTPNHTYILNEQGHLVGYRKTSTKEYIQFKSPMKQFSKTSQRRNQGPFGSTRLSEMQILI